MAQKFMAVLFDSDEKEGHQLVNDKSAAKKISSEQTETNSRRSSVSTKVAGVIEDPFTQSKPNSFKKANRNRTHRTVDRHFSEEDSKEIWANSRIVDPLVLKKLYAADETQTQDSRFSGDTDVSSSTHRTLKPLQYYAPQKGSQRTPPAKRSPKQKNLKEEGKSNSPQQPKTVKKLSSSQQRQENNHAKTTKKPFPRMISLEAFNEQKRKERNESEVLNPSFNNNNNNNNNKRHVIIDLLHSTDHHLPPSNVSSDNMVATVEEKDERSCSVLSSSSLLLDNITVEVTAASSTTPSQQSLLGGVSEEIVLDDKSATEERSFPSSSQKEVLGVSDQQQQHHVDSFFAGETLLLKNYVDDLPTQKSLKIEICANEDAASAGKPWSSSTEDLWPPRTINTTVSSVLQKNQLPPPSMLGEQHVVDDDSNVFSISVSSAAYEVEKEERDEKANLYSNALLSAASEEEKDVLPLLHSKMPTDEIGHQTSVRVVDSSSPSQHPFPVILDDARDVDQNAFSSTALSSSTNNNDKDEEGGNDEDNDNLMKQSSHQQQPVDRNANDDERVEAQEDTTAHLKQGYVVFPRPHPWQYHPWLLVHRDNDADEWFNLHNWARCFRREYGLTTFEFLRLIGAEERTSFVQYLSCQLDDDDDDGNTKPSDQEGTSGHALRKILSEAQASELANNPALIQLQLLSQFRHNYDSTATIVGAEENKVNHQLWKRLMMDIAEEFFYEESLPDSSLEVVDVQRSPPFESFVSRLSLLTYPPSHDGSVMGGVVSINIITTAPSDSDSDEEEQCHDILIYEICEKFSKFIFSVCRLTFKVELLEHRQNVYAAAPLDVVRLVGVEEVVTGTCTIIIVNGHYVALTAKHVLKCSFPSLSVIFRDIDSSVELAQESNKSCLTKTTVAKNNLILCHRSVDVGAFEVFPAITEIPCRFSDSIRLPSRKETMDVKEYLHFPGNSLYVRKNGCGTHLTAAKCEINEQGMMAFHPVRMGPVAFFGDSGALWVVIQTPEEVVAQRKRSWCGIIVAMVSEISMVNLDGTGDIPHCSASPVWEWGDDLWNKFQKSGG